jgi:hypothetical protein
MGVDRPAALAGRPRRGGKQLVALAEQGAEPIRNPMRPAASQRSASAWCSSRKPATGCGSKTSSAPKATTPRRPIASSPSTTPRLASEPMLVWWNMSLTQVTPDSSSSAPLSMAPTLAISAVR